MSKTSSSFERIAITGFSLCNALGFETETVWQKTLAMESGVVRLTDTHAASVIPQDTAYIFDTPFIPGNTSYCDALALCRPPISHTMLDLSPQEASVLSASGKLTLYTGKEAITAANLQNAGYAPERVAVLVSQNAGELSSTLWDMSLSLHAPYIAAQAATLGAWNTEQTQNFIDILRQKRLQACDNSLLFRLNCVPGSILLQQYGFCGPSFSLGAACSSSVTAIATAIHMLRSGSIDAAIVGGGEEIYNPLYMIEFSAMHALARAKEPFTEAQQYSRPFDRHRTGFVLAEGAATLILERESAARQRHATIHGFITGLGHATTTKGLIEPDAEMQKKVIAQSFTEAAYTPDHVDLIECHATGTVQGDLEEGRALAHIYNQSSTITTLSAYKGQIGHNIGASGAIALIHGLLSMRDKILPGTLNYHEEDKNIPLHQAKFQICNAPTPWACPPSGIRRMQLNSFAFGGSCIALQVEEFNDKTQNISLGGTATKMQHTAQCQTSSTHKDKSTQSEEVVNGVRMVTLTHQDALWRIGSTTPSWQQELLHISASPSEEDFSLLRRKGVWLMPASAPPKVAITCCGQGAAWPHMGRALYDTFPEARAAMDRVAAIADWDVLSLMDEKDMEKIVRTRWQQPYLFLLEYAQASYLASLGFEADIISGHSLGEVIALSFAGVYPSLEVSWNVINGRAQLMDELESKATNETGMLAVHGPASAVEEILQAYPSLYVSNYNSPTQHILSGSSDILAEARRVLRKKKIPAITLGVSMAFHHPQMRVIHDKTLECLNKLPLQAPHKPVISGVTARAYPSDIPSIHQHLVDIDENSVRWVDCVHTMWNTYTVRHFVEFGPADTISGLTADIQPKAVCIPVGRKNHEVEGMRAAIAHLYALGHIPKPSAHIVPASITTAALSHSVSTVSTTHNADTHTSAPAATPEQEPTPSYIEDIMPLLMNATGYARHDLKPDMDLRHDLSLRSSRFPTIMYAIEKNFQVNITFEDLIEVSTIRDLANVIARLRSDKQEIVNTDTETMQSNTSCSCDIKQEAKKGLEQERLALEKLPVWRSIIQSSPLTLPAVRELTDAKQFLPALIVGTATASHAWHTYFINIAGTENVLHVETAEQALGMLQQTGLKPAVLIIVPDDHKENASTIKHVPSHQEVLQHLLLLQAFVKNSEACACFIHETTTSDILGTPLFAALTGLLLTAAQEYPKINFKAVCSEDTLSEEAATIWKKQLLQKEGKTLPLSIQITPYGITALQAHSHPWASTPDGISITHQHVIVVSGGGKGITPHALLGIAPLKCTFILLGRSEQANTETLQKITALGAQCFYRVCDVSDADAVNHTIQNIYDEWGRIDGIIHGAGATMDATLAELDTTQIAKVLAIKYMGLYHLLHATQSCGLRYAIAFSSLAGWLGNYGQGNYSAANRAMGALLAQWCDTHNVAWHSIWLPPIMGEGMANNDETYAQLRLRGLSEAWLTVQELPTLFARELLCHTSGHALWHRKLPTVAAVPTTPPPSVATQKGLQEQPHIYPHIYPCSLLAGEKNLFRAERCFSLYKDIQLCTQEGTDIPFAPATMLLDTLYEGAAMAFPWLHIRGAEKVSIGKHIPCPHKVSRESLLTVKGDVWACPQDSVSPYMTCDTHLEVRDITANGRRTDTWKEHTQGNIILTPSSTTIIPVHLELNHENIQCATIHTKTLAHWTYSRYSWLWACLNALKTFVMSDAHLFDIAHIASLQHVTATPEAEILFLTWQKTDVQKNIFTGQFALEDKSILLTIQGIHFVKSAF